MPRASAVGSMGYGGDARAGTVRVLVAVFVKKYGTSFVLFLDVFIFSYWADSGSRMMGGCDAQLWQASVTA